MKNTHFFSKQTPARGWHARAVPVAAILVLSSVWAHAQVAAGRTGVSAAVDPAVAGAQTEVLKQPANIAKPAWRELSESQRTALTPLAAQWDALSASQKRKWIALSKNYHELGASDQTLMHARMDDWVKLSPQQRRTARLNFAETKRLSTDEKQQKWEAYQALSPDARHKLTESAPSLPPGAAVAVRPVPPKKLATVPMTGPDAEARPKLAAPNQINPHTLLPQRINPPTHARATSPDAGAAKP